MVGGSGDRAWWKAGAVVGVVGGGLLVPVYNKNQDPGLSYIPGLKGPFLQHGTFIPLCFYSNKNSLCFYLRKNINHCVFIVVYSNIYCDKTTTTTT